MFSWEVKKDIFIFILIFNISLNFIKIKYYKVGYKSEKIFSVFLFNDLCSRLINCIFVIKV